MTVGASGVFDVVNANTSGITSIANAGSTDFSNSTSAGTITITNSGNLSFFDSSRAGSATITNNQALRFFDAGTAFGATITNNGSLQFFDTSTAGSAVIANGGLLQFFNASTAGSAGITNNQTLQFHQTATAGNAAITNTISGTTDFSWSTGPNNDHKLGAGSLNGGGTFSLGQNELTVGGNNLSTNVTGVIADGGAGGSLVKVGTGTLTLSGSNTYTGGTTVSGGTLQLGDGGTSGSIVGDVINNGVLAFNRSDAVSFAAAISGSGAVRQVGAGTTTLSGSNSYGEIGRAHV